MFVFRAPLWLLLLILPAALAVLTAWWRPRDHRRLLELALRLLALALLAVAAAQPAWQEQSRSGELGLIVDTSHSLSAADRAVEAAWLQRTSAAATGDNPVTVIRFAGSASVTTLRGSVSAGAASRLVQPGNTADSTDIESALRLAAGLMPSGSTVILLSDGDQTRGIAAPAAAALASQRIILDTVLLNRQSADVAITRMVLPASAATGATVPLQLTVQSTKTVTATVQLFVDGHSIGSEPLGVQAGANPYLVTLPTLAPGRHTVRAIVTAPGDTIAQNNTLDAVTTISGTPRLLLVTAQPAHSTALALLQRQAVTIVADTPKAMPTAAAALETYSGIVLDDLPATALNAKQVAALNTAVRSAGVGLLALGGTHSLTQGHYSQTALENILPVLSVTPASLQNGNVALQLVLDRSGSMADLAGDEPKIVMSRSAADIAVDFAQQHKDDLGVVSFDIQEHILFPMQLVTSGAAAAAHSMIAGMQADGGTNIYAGLQRGIQQVMKSSAPYHHIILMTDGRSDPANYLPLLQEAQRDKITISTLALGSDADIQLLRYIASVGKGRFYYTSNASDLPRIFAEEARLSAGSAAVSGKIGVQITHSSPPVRSLGTGPLVDLGGYTATVLKPSGFGDLETQIAGRQPDPLLARWQYGLGRVLVWTPGLENSWSASWRQAYPSFWSDVVDWILRGASVPLYSATLDSALSPEAIQIDTARNSGTPANLQQLTLEVGAPNGHLTTLDASQTGPGTYSAPFTFAQSGVYTVTVQQAAGGAPTVSLLAVPYSPEYLPRAPDSTLLGAISAPTGGRTLHAVAALTALAGRGATVTLLWWAVALAALAAFIAALVSSRLIERSDE